MLPTTTPPAPHADATTTRLLVELRDELADLVRGEACDHAVNICWCATFALIACTTARIKQVDSRRGQAQV